MKINYRRKNPPRYPTRISTYAENYLVLDNGYAPQADKPWKYIDKSLHHWGRTSEFTDKSFVSKGIGNDFSNGRRGMAKSVRGAKKFVRSRFRFRENTATRQLMHEYTSG
jgi:hypothetical protein